MSLTVGFPGRRPVAVLHLEEHWFSGAGAVAVIHELRRMSMISLFAVAIVLSFFLFFSPCLPCSTFQFHCTNLYAALLFPRCDLCRGKLLRFVSNLNVGKRFWCDQHTENF